MSKGSDSRMHAGIDTKKLILNTVLPLTTAPDFKSYDAMLDDPSIMHLGGNFTMEQVVLEHTKRVVNATKDRSLAAKVLGVEPAVLDDLLFKIGEANERPV